MKVYWLTGKRSVKVQYHLVPNMQVAMIVVNGLKQCGIDRIWIERELAHKRVGY